jgi:CDGSH-type Zn-finger protein
MSSSGEAPKISVRPNGPYVVTGELPVVRRRMVESEHGQPLTWQTTAELETTPVYALCRCGGSSTKPFCDSTHKKNGFEGTETAPDDDYEDREKTYAGTGLVVRDDRSICEHAGFCGNRLTNVWKLMRSDATEDSITRAQVMSMVEHCPSGALTYRLEADGADVEPDLRQEVGVVTDGPLFVSGRVVVERADGRPFETRNRVTLCRCGGSANKPLCDGSHKQIGFRDG